MLASALAQAEALYGGAALARHAGSRSAHGGERLTVDSSVASLSLTPVSLLATTAVAGLVVLVLWIALATPDSGLKPILLFCPMLALLAAAAVRGRASRPLGLCWMALAGAAAAGMAAEILALQANVAAGTGLFLLSSMLLAGGVAGLLHLRERDRGAEIVLDMALLAVTATLITLRWSPGWHELLAARAGRTAGPLAATVLIPIVSGCAFLFAAALALVQTRRGGLSVALALVVGTGALGLAGLPIALDHGGIAAGSTATAVGWAAVALAGVITVRSASPALLSAGSESGGQRLRQLVGPVSALVIAAVLVDSAWRAPIADVTALTLGVSGLLLALRVSQLLHATHSHSAERLELAQTKMLVDVSRALAGTTDLQTTLQVVTGWARRMLHARAAAIELLDDDGQHLEFRAIDGLPLAVMKLKFPVEDSFTGWVVRHGRARSTVDPELDVEISEGSREVLGRSPLAAVPLRYHDHVLGALSCVGDYPFNESDLELLGALADQASVAIENARLFSQVHALSLTDELTGLPNRRQLARDLTREFAAATRGRRLIAIMFDLNGFKRYNDQYGHLAGDEALQLFASALAAETRAMNLAARYGGDEFLALLADNDVHGAEVFIGRVRRRFPGAGARPEQRELSVSAGIAEYSPLMGSADDLVAAADRALYDAKSSLKAATG